MTPGTGFKCGLTGVFAHVQGIGGMSLGEVRAHELMDSDLGSVPAPPPRHPLPSRTRAHTLGSVPAPPRRHHRSGDSGSTSTVYLSTRILGCLSNRIFPRVQFCSTWSHFSPGLAHWAAMPPQILTWMYFVVAFSSCLDVARRSPLRCAARPSASVPILPSSCGASSSPTPYTVSRALCV